MNHERRDAELRDRLADDRPLTEALKSVIDNSPELSELFKVGIQLPANNQQEKKPDRSKAGSSPPTSRWTPNPRGRRPSLSARLAA